MRRLAWGQSLCVSGRVLVGGLVLGGLWGADLDVLEEEEVLIVLVAVGERVVW